MFVKQSESGGRHLRWRTSATFCKPYVILLLNSCLLLITYPKPVFQEVRNCCAVVIKQFENACNKQAGGEYTAAPPPPTSVRRRIVLFRSSACHRLSFSPRRCEHMLRFHFLTCFVKFSVGTKQAGGIYGAGPAIAENQYHAPVKIFFVFGI
jgi:hypothetical protein